MVSDAHVHTLGHERADAIMAAMDRIGLTHTCLLSPPELASTEAQRDALRWMASLTRTAPDRLLGYFWLNPLVDRAPELVAEAAATDGIRAFKLMSDHWYPHDPGVRRTLDAIARTGMPILFHAGILWSHMDSSRFCRPVDFEVMLHYPTTRFCLAHVAWPWVDECLAVAARMRDGIEKLTGGPNTMYIDLSPGTPMEVREEAFRKVFLIGETNRILWGSDDAEPETFEKASRVLAFDRDLLDRIGVPSAVQSRVFGLNHLEFLGMTTC